MTGVSSPWIWVWIFWKYYSEKNQNFTRCMSQTCSLHKKVCRQWFVLKSLGIWGSPSSKKHAFNYMVKIQLGGKSSFYIIFTISFWKAIWFLQVQPPIFQEIMVIIKIESHLCYSKTLWKIESVNKVFWFWYWQRLKKIFF